MRAKGFTVSVNELGNTFYRFGPGPSEKYLKNLDVSRSFILSFLKRFAIDDSILIDTNEVLKQSPIHSSCSSSQIRNSPKSGECWWKKGLIQIK